MCFSSKTCTFVPSAGCSAEAFWRAHSRFTNTFGKPALCLVDNGPSIMMEAFRTKWLVTPKVAPWRAGHAGRHFTPYKKDFRGVSEGSFNNCE